MTDKEEINKLSDDLLWSFQPHTNFDAPFHGLISTGGVELIDTLDALLLLTPFKAAPVIVKTFNDRSEESEANTKTGRKLMVSLKEALQRDDVVIRRTSLIPAPA